MISPRALFDVAKRPEAADERWRAALRLFRRRRHVKSASTSTPADLRSAIRSPLGSFYMCALLNYGANKVTLPGRHRGDGQPVVLLHGHPRTQTTWHWAAPQLRWSYFVVCPDLRGYGQSTPPPDAREHVQSFKRAGTSCLLVTAACG